MVHFSHDSLIPLLWGIMGLQLGPKIRIGGTLGQIGQSVKVGAGKVASAAAPVVSFFNPAIGAGLAGAGRILDTSDGGAGIGDVLGSAAKTYGVGRLAKATGLSDRARALLGSLNIPGLPGGGGAPGGSGTWADASTGGMPGDGSDGGSLWDNIKAEGGRVVRRVARGESPIAGIGGGEATGAGPGGGSGGGMSLLDKLLLGGTVAAGAADAVQRRNLQNKAVDYATGSYEARAPLRARALSLLSSDPAPDPRLAAISQDPGNVYDRARRARMLAASATSPTDPPA